MKFPHIRESSHKNIFVWSVERLLYRWNVWMNTRHWCTKLTPLCTIARYARSPLKTKEYTKLTLRAITWTYPALCATRNFLQDGLWIITRRRSMRTPPLTHLTSSIRITSLTSSCFWHLLFIFYEIDNWRQIWQTRWESISLFTNNKEYISMFNTDSILYVVQLPCALLQTGHLETVQVCMLL